MIKHVICNLPKLLFQHNRILVHPFNNSVNLREFIKKGFHSSAFRLAGMSYNFIWQMLDI